MMQVLMATADPKQEIIRKNLTVFRNECDLSRAQLADLSGIPEKNILRYETGETKISLNVISILAHVFGRDEGDFFKEDPPPPPKPEQLPRLFLRTWPKYDVPEEILTEVRRAIDHANDKLRGRKAKK